MDPRRNPFAPGAGSKPPEFAGRDELIEDADIAFDRLLNGLHANSLFLLGLRGVGKTVLLNTLRDKALEKGVETVRIEVPDSEGGHLAREIVPELATIVRRLDRRHEVRERVAEAAGALRNFASAFRVRYEGLELGIEPETVEAGSGTLEYDMPALLRATAVAAKSRGGAVGLFIDEIQYLTREELAALARSCHEAAQSGLPLLVVGTGLPQVAALAGEAKSYAERLFEYPEVGPLGAEASRRVLREPIRRFEADITDPALDRIVEDTAGYAYFLQTWGKFAWQVAEGEMITEDDVEAALPDIRTHLDRHFFRVRFDRCSELEQMYLRAMAELGAGRHRSGDIARTRGTESPQVATVRKKLIQAGMIYSQRHGETAFTVPLFDEFMKRAMPELIPYKPRRRRRS